MCIRDSYEDHTEKEDEDLFEMDDLNKHQLIASMVMKQPLM